MRHSYLQFIPCCYLAVNVQVAYMQSSLAWVQQLTVVQAPAQASVALLLALQPVSRVLLLPLAQRLALLLALAQGLVLLLRPAPALALLLPLTLVPGLLLLTGLQVLVWWQLQLLQALLLQQVLLLLQWLVHCWCHPSMHSLHHPHSPTAASDCRTLLLVPQASLHMTGHHPKTLLHLLLLLRLLLHPLLG
jgi:hypothetical protein